MTLFTVNTQNGIIKISGKYPEITYFCKRCKKFIGHPEKGVHHCKSCFNDQNFGENSPMFGRIGEKSNRWDSSIKQRFCDYCGKELPRKGSLENRSWPFRVCKNCYYGKFTPQHKGGFREYGKEWTSKLRFSIMERDNFTCQNPHCLNSSWNTCDFILEKLKLDVHHIDGDRKNCAPINLITLCHSCHSKERADRLSWKTLFLQVVAAKYQQKIYRGCL